MQGLAKVPRKCTVTTRQNAVMEGGGGGVEAEVV